MASEPGLRAVWQRAHQSYLPFCLMAYTLVAVSIAVDYLETGSALGMSIPGAVLVGFAGTFFGVAMWRAHKLEGEHAE